MACSTPFKRLILRIVLRNVSPMVSRLVSVSEEMEHPSFSDYNWGLAGIMPLPGQEEWSLIHRLVLALFDLLAFFTSSKGAGPELAH
jgi:hypothetical protein